MKILVVCQYYDPEPFRISDICEELVRRGHEVKVVTGLPNYPMGKIYDGYRNGKKRDDIRSGVRVHRCFTIGRRHNLFHRFLNYYSYAISSSLYTAWMKEQYDVVFVNQLSPVMMAGAGIVYKKKHHVPLILYCLDLWPASLEAGGIRTDSLLYRYFHGVSEKIYRQADRILITSRQFSEYFKQEFHIDRAVYLPQYAEDIFKPEKCSKKADGLVNLMFAGNIGAAQSINTIIDAAKLTKDIPNLRWHIVGDGSELERLKISARGTDSVIFHGRKTLEEMPACYSIADAMLVTMKKSQSLNMTLPGKVQTYMAAGKPIIGAADGEIPAIIQQAGCGFCAGAEDTRGLAGAVRQFIQHGGAKKMGEHSRLYYRDNFTKEIFMEQLEQELLLTVKCTHTEVCNESIDDKFGLRYPQYRPNLHGSGAAVGGRRP